MRLAISNIAWDINGDEKIADLLHHYNIDAIDVIPGKYFPDLDNISGDVVFNVRNWWRNRGIEITGMQALLFGTTGLNIFGTKDVREEMLRHFSKICRIGAGLGSKYLVFGSPKNRDRIGLSDQAASNIATDFFQRLGDIAISHEVAICLEPIPVRYGANFMINSAETAEIVLKTANPSIRMQLDLGALTINNENPATVLRDYAFIVGHVHASEPDLVPIGDGSSNHKAMATAIEQYLPNRLVSIEMIATKNEPQEVSIARALNVADKHYRCETEEST